MNFKKLLYYGDNIRILWPTLMILVLIIIGEMLVVDPIGIVLEKVGLVDGSGPVEHEWPSALHDVLKRSIRSILVLLSVAFTIKLLMGHSHRFMGITFERNWIRHLGLGIFLGFIIQIIPLLIMLSFGWYSVEGWLWEFKLLNVLMPAILYSTIFSLETAIIEESIFRGFLMNAFTERYNIRTGLVVSSIVFGLLHFSGFSNDFPWWLSLSSATLAGFVFGQAYLLYDNIWVPLGIHFAIHFAARTLGTVGVSPDEATLLVTKVEGPVMLVVTKSGGASILELVGYISVFVILLFLKKNQHGLGVGE
ncbi:MAG: CPBP family intramembrane metalloprotease [Candidatus Marinimicrobia bacterium]|nr:CPBP family intramembrane metalloprotease [Candidatus Neomarinimicrobiota bacterium]